MTSDAESRKPRAIDRFEIRGRLGAGAMGVVLEAYDRERKQVIALKTLPNSEASALYRFKREFRTLADISHPNLVNLYDLFVEPDKAFFTMEKVEGSSFLAYVRPAIEVADDDTLNEAELEQKAKSDTAVESMTLPTGSGSSAASPNALDTLAGSMEATASLASVTHLDAPVRESSGGRGPLDERRLRDVLRQLALGVAAIHAAGKLHRDLKPSNVMVTRAGRLVILDFGLAIEHKAQEGGEGLGGTAAYMAPEQVDGATVPASDWYAVGVMLFEALTGHRPFVGTLIQVLVDKQTLDAPTVHSMAPEAPADLASLCDRLLAREPEARPDAAEVLRVFGGAVSTLPSPSELGSEDLVGREPHLAALQAAATAVAGGEAVAVYVHGPSGTGKSTLVRAFLADARRSPDTVLLPSRCYLHESVPYKALDGVIDSLSRLLTSMPRDLAARVLPDDLWALARLFPVMATVLEQFSERKSPQTTIDRLEVRRKGLMALRELLANLAGHPGDRSSGDTPNPRRRVIIYIDDLQWADADSAILLDELLRAPNAPAILLVATFRSEEIENHPFLAELLAHVDDRSRRQVAVAPLRDAEIESLVGRLIHDSALVRPLVSTIVREAAGSPFLAEQLALHVMQGGGTTTGVSLGEMIGARLDAQPSGARALVNALAVAAHPLPSEVAASAAAVSGDERPLVKSLVTARLLRVSSSEERIELYHDRLRETVFGGLAASEVRDLHAQIASAMERCGLDDPEALFGHYRGAGASEQAAVFAKQAATKASEALAFDQAAHFYQAALELAPDELDSQSSTQASLIGRARLERDLGDAFANAGRSREAAHAYLRAAARAEGSWATELRRAAAEQLVCSGHLDEGRKALSELLAEADLPMAPTPKRALLSLVARRLKIKLRGYEFSERPESEIPVETLHRIDVCWAASSGLSMIDNIRGADYSARGLLLSLDAGEPVRVANSMSMEAAFLASGGQKSNRALAFRLSAKAIELAKQTRSPAALAQVMMTAAACTYLSGLWRKAIDHAGEAEVILRERCPGSIWQKATTLRFGFGSMMYAGEIAELCRRLPFALRDAEERGNLYAYADLSARLFARWLATDDAEGHRNVLADVFARWTNQGYHIQHFNALRSLLHGDLYEGAHARAAARLAEQTPALEGSMLSRVQLVRAETSQLRAQIQLARLAAGEVAGSERKTTFKAIDKDLAALRAEKEPWCVALATLLDAGLQHQRGDASGGRATLVRAIEQLRSTDMAMHVAAAERTLGVLEGGDAGAQRITRAEAWMREQSIQRPDRMAQAFVSGFSPPL